MQIFQPQSASRLGLPRITRRLLLLILCWLAPGVHGQGAGAVSQALQWTVLNEHRHDPGYFTQGLVFHQGTLYESTGLYGYSRLIKYGPDLTPAQTLSLPGQYFGEGITIVGDEILHLTWRSGTGFVWAASDLRRIRSLTYQGEGWGITAVGGHIWMSNGSDQLNCIDRQGRVLASVQLVHNGQPIDRINELDTIGGLVLANRWHDNRVFLLDPKTGNSLAWLNLESLARRHQAGPEAVLNGLAWHEERQTLWATGKNWDTLYELQVQGLGADARFPGNHDAPVDTDGDGYLDAGDCDGSRADAFPNDPREWLDSDLDGVGDNRDSDNANPAVAYETMDERRAREGIRQYRPHGIKPLPADARNPARVVADLDDPVAMQRNSTRFTLTGIFDEEKLAEESGWNWFETQDRKTFK